MHDVIKWKHFPCYWPFVRGTGEFPSERPVTRSFGVLFDLRLNKRLVNNREAGDLRRHRAHYDVTEVATVTSDKLTMDFRIDSAK